MQLDPKKKLFYLILNNRKYRLWTLLNVLEVSDDVIAKTWGDELLLINKKGALNNEVSEMTSIYKKVYRRDESDYNKVLEGLKNYFNNYTEVDPNTTRITLGKSHSKVNGATLLAASKKLLDINKGTQKPDDRDSLIFKDLYGIDDLLVAHFASQAEPIVKKISRRLGTKERVREVISSGTFGKPVKEFFTVGAMSATPPQTNPLSILSDWKKTTPMGPGGIQTSHAITLDTRDVQPSHIGVLDPLSTPESGKVGVNVGLTVGVKKDGQDMLVPVMLKSGVKSYWPPLKIYENYVGFPDEYRQTGSGIKPVGRSVRALYKGESLIVPAKNVEAYLFSAQDMFSIASNLVPFMHATQGNRASTAGRMLTQAMSLKEKEAPLVRVKDSKRNVVWEDAAGGFLNPVLGKMNVGNQIKNSTGTVTRVTDDYVYIRRDQDGKTIKKGLYNNFPLNQDGFLHSKPLVKKGDKIKHDTPLSETNYSVGNTLSLGRNLKVAYMPYKGYNFEDGAVITESAAEKMAHESIARKNIFFSPKTAVFELGKFRAHYPGTVDPENRAKLDKEGLPIIGETFYPGEVLAAYLEERDLTDTDKVLRKLNKAIFSNYVKKVVEWDEDEAGEVIDVRRSGRNIDIYLKSTHPFKEGDKLAGRYGNKNIVTKIIPDSDAPHLPNGSAVDIILNPHGVPGRMNIGQMLETAAGKIARKTGKPYFVENFSSTDAANDIKQEMKKLNIESDEVLTDGKEGKPFENKVFVGDQYFVKLRHTVKKKQGAHATGTYDINEQPTGKGAQKIDPMLTYALLSHGAKKNLYEMSALKGRQNDEYWRRLQLGLPPVKPNRNFVFEKMTNYLKGAGVNIKKDGNRLRMLPLTDKETLKMSNGELKEPGQILKGKDLAAKPGGLFDPQLTGGHFGTNWTHIKLHRSIPSPMYEDAIMKLLGLTRAKYLDVLQGKMELNGKTGMDAIKDALSSMKIENELRKTVTELKDAPPTNVNKLNSKVRYLQALKDLGHDDPTSAYFMKYVPIIPPQFRPVYPLPSGDLAVSDINKHYRNVGLITNSKKKLDDLGAVSKDDGLRYDFDLYNGVKSLQGFIDPQTYGSEKYKGVIKELSGDQAKYGLIHSQAWGKRQDLSARSTITVEPTLGIDEVGIPKYLAQKYFQPFVIKELVSQGMPAAQALKEVKAGSERAQHALTLAMDKRPVMLNRAPSLHKHSIQSFKPVLMDGKSIRLNPLIVKGFNADFDGDTMGVHVPVEPEAVDEAWKMLPSKNIFKHGDNSIVPNVSQDYLLGVYYLSKIGKDTKQAFSSWRAAQKAGLKYTDVFLLNGQKRTIGQILLNRFLPDSLKDYNRELDKKTVSNLLEEVAKNHQQKFPDVINNFKDLGYMYAYQRGSTISLDDFAINRSYRDKLIKQNLAGVKPGTAGYIDKVNKLSVAVQKAQDKALSKTNNVYEMLESGSFGKKDSARQILSMPGIMQDVKGNPIKTPILKSYGEGLGTSDYWNSLYGVRKGQVDRAVNTMDSGALNKALLSVTRRTVIVEDDCDTKKFITEEVDSKDALDRFLAATIPGVGPRNSLVDSSILLKLKSSKVKEVKVRSPLTCEATNGICRHCYGLLPNGELPSIGENVGVQEGQALTERSTQLTMQTFHTGGTALGGGGIVGSFPRLKQLLEVPETLSNKATLVTARGTVESIQKNAIGGHEVEIDGKVYTIPPEHKVTVNKGDVVGRGQAISTGNIQPQELGKLKGHLPAQQYIVNELNNIYQDDFNKKSFETVVRAVSDNAVVTDAPARSGYYRGDRSSISELDAINKKRKKEGLDLIKYNPYFKSIETANVDQDDWLTRFTTNRIKQAVQEGVSKGSYANLHGKDPIPAYLYGDEFGKGDAAKGEFY